MISNWWLIPIALIGLAGVWHNYYQNHKDKLTFASNATLIIFLALTFLHYNLIFNLIAGTAAVIILVRALEPKRHR